MIKPTKEAKFRDVVDALDEMTINDVRRYALVDIAEPEQMLINASEGGGAAPAAAPPQ